MDKLVIPQENVPEITEAVRLFASLPPVRQQMALLIMRGIQIGEDIQFDRAFCVDYDRVSTPGTRPSA